MHVYIYLSQSCKLVEHCLQRDMMVPCRLLRQHEFTIVVFGSWITVYSTSVSAHIHICTSIFRMQNFASTRPSVWLGLSKTSLLDTAVDEIHGIICKLLSSPMCCPCT